MNLPPIPPFDSGKSYEEAMTVYGELCVKEYCKSKAAHLRSHKPLFNATQVAEIRKRYWDGHTFKEIKEVFPMCEASFYNIVMNRGAYK